MISHYSFSKLSSLPERRLSLFLCLLTFLCLFYLPCSYAASGRAECNSVPSKILARPVSYCVLLPPSFDADKTRRFPVLYFLHGLGDNEQTFLHTGGWNLVEDLREKGRLKEFLIATPAGGASFYINSRDGKVRYEAFLLQEFFPFIERRYRVRPGRANRAISGISMGGYGAFHLAFAHPELFSSVSAHSAALIEKLPIFLFGNGSVPAPGRSRLLGGVFGMPPDPSFWDSNSPLTLARSASLSGLSVYFDCGSEDDFGFDAGAVALDKILTSRKIPHEFHLYPGRHDWSYFASHIESSFSFHSARFDLQSTAVSSSSLRPHISQLGKPQWGFFSVGLSGNRRLHTRGWCSSAPRTI